MALGDDNYAEVTAVGIQGLSGGGGTGNGATGSTGPAGVDGATGPTGVNGATGPTGVNGASGYVGRDGASGVDGASGYIGRDGATGPANGPIGASGFTGEQGASGLTGATGVDGASGQTGATGVDGASGIIGSIGETGATGAGLTGATGLGFNIVGPWDVEATYYRNEIVFFENKAYVWYTETPGNTALSPDQDTDATYWAISSAPGATGSLGETGATGAGLTGATGSQGEQGASGIGYTGATGEQGTQGASGEVGASGSIGATGAGLTGASGVTGNDGATGPTGASGLGLTGASGYIGRDGASGVNGATGVGRTGATGIGVPGATGVGVIETLVYTTSSTDEELVDIIDTTLFRSVKYEMQETYGNSYAVSELRFLHDDENAFLTQYAGMGDYLGTFASYFSPESNDYSSPQINNGGMSYWNGTALRIYTSNNTVIQSLLSIVAGVSVRLNNLYDVTLNTKFIEISAGIYEAQSSVSHSPILLLDNIKWDGTGACELRYTAVNAGTELKYQKTQIEV